MPRPARASVGDLCYHVINRGNAQNVVFHKAGDYQVFVELIGLACDRISMQVLSYFLMPNYALCGASHHISTWLCGLTRIETSGDGCRSWTLRTGLPTISASEVSPCR